MRNIFVIGAGRSSGALIQYLLDHAEMLDAQVIVGDQSLALAEGKIGAHPRGKAIAFNIFDDTQRQEQIRKADIVLSLLPADMHFVAAKDCLTFGKNLVTASYVSKEMASLHEEVHQAGLLFLNEIGVDPGIDHMSAMEVIHRIQNGSGELTGFWSYCGGLIAPECNNLWGYKFTWAPRNVILAGQATAIFLEDDRIRYRNYMRLFSEITEIEVPGHGKFEAYANRDSIKYLPLYGLEGIKTLFRGTLRFPGYCRLWNAFLKLGLTDDSVKMQNSEGMTRNDFIFSFAPSSGGVNNRDTLAQFLGEPSTGEVMEKITQLDFFSDRKIMLQNATPAQVLQSILEEYWVLGEDDKDLLVMQHRFDFRQNGKSIRIISSMVDKGHDTTITAMARTVGLPMAIATKLILQGKITATGVVIPTLPQIYEPVLAELHELGIRFTEQQFEISESK
jgi:saccharopine dehydrogenase-like NADP-dependent oxidoreductase